MCIIDTSLKITKLQNYKHISQGQWLDENIHQRNWIMYREALKEKGRVKHKK